MDYKILFWEDTGLTIIIGYWILLIFMAIRDLLNDMGWNFKSKLVLVVLAVLLIVIPYYGIDRINYNILNGHGDATAYAYKRAIETNPQNAYGRNYYENLTDEERNEINNLISNMDENRGKIGFYYGYDDMAYNKGYSSPAELYGDSLSHMLFTPAIIPGIMVALLWMASETINRMIKNLKDQNYKLKAENKKLEAQITDLKKNVRHYEVAQKEASKELDNIKKETENYLQGSAAKEAENLKIRINNLEKRQSKQLDQWKDLKEQIDNGEKRLKEIREEQKKAKKELKQIQTQKEKEEEVSNRLNEDFFKDFKA